MNSHLDGSAVRHHTTLHIETLGSVAVRVDAVSAAGGRRGRWGGASTVAEVPGTVEGSAGCGVSAVCAGVREGIVDSGGEVETTVWASRALAIAST